MSDPGLEQVLERYRGEWEAGRFDRLIPAFMFCARNGLDFPDWLYEAVLDDLDFAYHSRRRGGRSARTGAVQDRWNRTHRLRHSLMRTILDYQTWEIELGIRTTPQNKGEAAREVERLLAEAESFARGSSQAIQESYNLLENKPE